MPDTLRAVFFDIDDTLFGTTEFARHARRNSVRAMIAAGVKLPEDEVLRELEEVIREFSSNYEHHYDKLLQRLPRQALGDVNRALVVAAGVVAYHDTKFRDLAPFPEVPDFLRAARESGLLLGVITHGWTQKQAEKLIRLGILGHFDPHAIFISDQVGISKPNPKLYALALRELGLEPRQAMMVGDSLPNDIAPPQRLGMRTAWARRAARERGASDIVPDHVIDDFDQLTAILHERYDLPRRPA